MFKLIHIVIINIRIDNDIPIIRDIILKILKLSGLLYFIKERIIVNIEKINTIVLLIIASSAVE